MIASALLIIIIIIVESRDFGGIMSNNCNNTLQTQTHTNTIQSVLTYSLISAVCDCVEMITEN